MTLERNSIIDEAIKAIQDAKKARAAAGFTSRQVDQMTIVYVKALERLKTKAPQA